MKLKLYFSLVTFLFITVLKAQVGIGTTTPNAQLQILSSNQATPANNDGLIIPKIDAFPATNPTASQQGMMVYLTTAVGAKQPGFYYWNNTSTNWFAVGDKTAWGTTGNAGTAIATNFLGTTDANGLIFRTNNLERMRIFPTGDFVVGATASPYAGNIFTVVGTAALPFGVNGFSANNGSGTWGEILTGSNTGFSAVQGVYGGSGAGAGVLGNYNGTGASAFRAGVIGVCSTPAAAGGGIGVYGANIIASGNQRIGVYGTYNGAAFGLSVVGVAFGGGVPAGNNDIAVVGWRANNANYSGYFNGNHVIANGTKSASVGTSKGNQLLYVTETPGVWFEDIGHGKLENGAVAIKLDPLFLETVKIDDKHPMRVFLQEEGDSNGLYVTPGKDGFIVKEKNNGTSSVSFSYRIMAKRLNFEDHRFGNDPVWGEGDTRKYNQYATPPPVDYNENVRFQENQKKNYRPTAMPKGFIEYFKLQEEAKKSTLDRSKTVTEN